MESSIPPARERLLMSLSFQSVLAFLDPKSCVKLQQLAKKIYTMVMPRSIYICPTSFQQVFAYIQREQALLTYDPYAQQFNRQKLTSPQMQEGCDHHSARITQLLNGKIFWLESFYNMEGKRGTILFEMKKDKNNFDKVAETQLVSINGAVACSNNAIYISGSQFVKGAECFCFDLADGLAKIKNLPQLLFGRFNHSMILINSRYLYVFGGQLTQPMPFSSMLFERLDTHNID